MLEAAGVSSLWLLGVLRSLIEVRLLIVDGVGVGRIVVAVVEDDAQVRDCEAPVDKVTDDGALELEIEEDIALGARFLCLWDLLASPSCTSIALSKFSFRSEGSLCLAFQ